MTYFSTSKAYENASIPEEIKEQQEEMDRSLNNTGIIQDKVEKVSINTPEKREDDMNSSIDIRQSLSPRAFMDNQGKDNLQNPDPNIYFERLSDMDKHDKKGHIREDSLDNKEDSFDQKDSQNNRSEDVNSLRPQENNSPNAENASNPVLTSQSERPDSSHVRTKRHELERGIIGMNLELKKLRDDLENRINKDFIELKDLRTDFMEFRESVMEEIQNNKEEIHNRFTEFKGHVNNIMLEYKESILVIQSYVDSQLISSRRDRIDFNIVIENLLKKARYHDEVSK